MNRFRCFSFLIFRLTLILLVSGCVASENFGLPENLKGPIVDQGLKHKKDQNLDQQWTDNDRKLWYGVSQGSRLIPESWFLNLEQPDNRELFLKKSHIDKFRYLTREKSLLPLGFIVDAGKSGPADDSNLTYSKLRWKSGQKSNEPWVGLNCSACHTNQINYKGKEFIVDGGTTLADFQKFIVTLVDSVGRTLNDPQKLERFSQAVLSNEYNPENKESLRIALNTWKNYRQKVIDQNRGNPNNRYLEYGPGRLDAVGHIFSKVIIMVDGKPVPFPKDAEPANQITDQPADAPVSYPFIWNIPQHTRVEWNGISSNSDLIDGFDYGALGRNTGEVTGVFGDVNIPPRCISSNFFSGLKCRITGWYRSFNGMESSARIGNLNRIEILLGKLRSPAWPSTIFGELDAELVAYGNAIYHGTDKGHLLGKNHCRTCHADISRKDLRIRSVDWTNPETKVTTEGPIEKMIPIISVSEPTAGTDPWMACNALTRMATSGKLEGTKDFFLIGDPLGKQAPVAQLLITSVAGAIINKKGELTEEVLRGLFRLPGEIEVYDGNITKSQKKGLTQEQLALLEYKRMYNLRIMECKKANDPKGIRAYKARPLNGIWATAPYLHNGSVRTLYDLLLPYKDRPTEFYIGSREFDEKDVGFVSRKQDGNLPNFLFKTMIDENTQLHGNSRKGHDYNNHKLNETFMKQDGSSFTARRALVEYMKTL